MDNNDLNLPRRYDFVMMDYNDKTLLGQVMEVYQDVNGMRLWVRHFCGDNWPVKPLISEVSFI